MTRIRHRSRLDSTYRYCTNWGHRTYYFFRMLYVTERFYKELALVLFLVDSLERVFQTRMHIYSSEIQSLLDKGVFLRFGILIVHTHTNANKVLIVKEIRWSSPQLQATLGFELRPGGLMRSALPERPLLTYVLVCLRIYVYNLILFCTNRK